MSLTGASALPIACRQLNRGNERARKITPTPRNIRLSSETKHSCTRLGKRKRSIGFARKLMPSPEGTARKAVAFITFSDSLFTAVESFFAQLSAMFGSIPLPNMLVIDGIRLKMVTARPLNEPYINSEVQGGLYRSDRICL